MNHVLDARRPILRSMIAAGSIVAVLAACGSDDTTGVDVDGGTVAVDVTALGGAVDSAVDDAVDVADDADATADDLAETLRANGLDSAASLVEQIDVGELVGDGEFTFFAPNDEAFTSLSADDLADLLSEPSQILETLRNHSVETTVTAAELAALEAVETRAAESVPVTVEGDTVTLGNGVVVVTTDIEVGDGVIHVVDGFLLPS